MTLSKPPISFCSLKFIDHLPHLGEVEDRLKETLRGWSSATPGKLMQTVLRERHAGPLVIVDEIEKIGDVNADNGTRHTLTDAL